MNRSVNQSAPRSESLARAGFVALFLVAGAAGAWACGAFASHVGVSGLLMLAAPGILGFAAAGWLASMLVFTLGHALATDDARVYAD